MTTTHRYVLERVGIGILVAGGLIGLLYLTAKAVAAGTHYIPLPNEINENVLYDGATIDVTQAVSTLTGDVMVWYRTETGDWLVYDSALDPRFNSLHQLEYGKTYVIRLTVYPQDWKVPNYK